MVFICSVLIETSHSFAVLEGLHQVGVRNPKIGPAAKIKFGETWGFIFRDEETKLIKGESWNSSGVCHQTTGVSNWYMAFMVS